MCIKCAMNIKKTKCYMKCINKSLANKGNLSGFGYFINIVSILLYYYYNAVYF